MAYRLQHKYKIRTVCCAIQNFSRNGPLLGIVLLTSCATAPEYSKPIDVNYAWESRQARLYKIQTWGMSARIAVRLQDGGWQAGIRWRQQNERYELDVLDPFRRKVAKLNGGPYGVNLTTAKGETAWAEDAESLLTKLLGYSLPVAGLRYWVRGIPDPQAKVEEIELDTIGRLVGLKQSGWKVDYQHYQDSVEFSMPEKLTFVNRGVRVKVVVNNWQLSTP